MSDLIKSKVLKLVKLLAPFEDPEVNRDVSIFNYNVRKNQTAY
jgi:hypothetical protein